MFDKKQVCKTAQACVWLHVSHFDLFIYLFVYSLKSQIVWVGWNQRLLFITTWTVNGHDIIISSKLRLSRGVWILNLEWVDIRLPSRTLPPICMSLVCCQNFAFNNRDMEPWLLDHCLFFSWHVPMLKAVLSQFFCWTLGAEETLLWAAATMVIKVPLNRLCIFTVCNC